MEDGVFRETVTGTPQGGVISPLLSNIYLHAFDRAFWGWPEWQLAQPATSSTRPTAA